MKEQERIQELLETHLSGTPYFVVEVAVKGSRATPKVVVTLDGDAGIGIDACAEISRALDAQVEAEDLFPKGYVLEVSSPGADQPLRLMRQYPKHVGRELHLQLRDGTLRTGTLAAADGQQIILAEQQPGSPAAKKKKETVQSTISLADIAKATVVVSFR